MSGDGTRSAPASPPGPIVGGLALATRAVHVARESGALGPTGERAATPPLHQTANYVYTDADGAAAAAAGEAFLYSRHGNPTTDALARAVADLEGAEAGLTFASGMAAIATAVFAAAAGGEVLAGEGIYGGSTDLLQTLGTSFGIRTRVVPAWDVAAVAAAIGPDTRALLVETLSNPLLRVPDLRALGDACHARGVALVVDSTFTTPMLARPIALGADLVVHSVSKYLSGHGDVVGGVVVGAAAALAPVRAARSLLGGVMDPFAGWLALRGLRTLPLRIARQCESAARLAAVLASLPAAKKVHYPGLPDHPDHARAKAQLAAPGAIIALQLADGAAARRFYDRVRVFSRAASLGEIVSLVTHPASFTHRRLSPEALAKTGIDDGLLRLSVGVEDVGDLEADLRQALA
ncbi:MAG TPA: aminotransferase class I/II-fold pyridoxal phosphate-dependent enzyme [Polyangia bacterium]|nr:aminotransferase class I/II-fold pyridoxal phosphate-dependent enzyme [Polyangia bacterium]